MIDFTERFWSKVRKTDSCWLWTGAQNSNGYGLFFIGRIIKFDGSTKQIIKTAHRMAFELVNGVIPDSLFVLHSCNTPRCVNPKHLRLGNHIENMDDLRNKNLNRRLTNG